MQSVLVLMLAASAAADLAFADVDFPPANVAALLQRRNDDRDACSTAEDVVVTCARSIVASDPVTVKARCFCCDDGTSNVAPYYKSCKDYLTESAPAYTDDISIVSVASSFCASASRNGFACGARGTRSSVTFPASVSATATGSATATASSLPTATFGGDDDDRPAACTSFASLYSSCSNSLRGFATMVDSQAASCMCYTRGVYTTAMDRYVSSCAKWIKTADPGKYETYLALQTFCADYPPRATTSTRGGSGFSVSDSAVSVVPSQSSDTSQTLSAAGTTTSTPTPTSDRTVTITPASTAPATTSAQANAAAAYPVSNGLAAWLAVILPFAVL